MMTAPLRRIVWAIWATALALGVALVWGTAGQWPVLAQGAEPPAKAKAKAKAVEPLNQAPAPDKALDKAPEATPVAYLDLPVEVRYAAMGEVGSHRTFRKTKTAEGADVYIAGWRRYHRSFEMTIAPDGTVVGEKRETTPAAATAAIEAAKALEVPKALLPKPAAPTLPEASPQAPQAKSNAPAVAVSYESHVQAILNKNCMGCHNAQRRRGGVELTTAAMVAKFVRAGNPNASLLHSAVTGTNGVRQMPLGKRLADTEIETIRAWIAGGAK